MVKRIAVYGGAAMFLKLHACDQSTLRGSFPLTRVATMLVTVRHFFNPSVAVLIQSRFRNYRRFRNCDSETTIQKLFPRFRNYCDSETNALQKLRFRNYRDSETIAIQKLWRFRNYGDSETAIQKLQFRNYRDSETIAI